LISDAQCVPPSGVDDFAKSATFGASRVNGQNVVIGRKLRERESRQQPLGGAVMFRKVLLFAVCAVLAFTASDSRAADADWPRRPIQVIVPFGAGGDTDMNARIFAKYLDPLLGKPLAVVNVGGGGSSIGSRRVKDARPDGHTVLFFHDAMLVNSASGVADFTYKDFEFSCIAGQETGTFVAVKSDAKWKTIKELVDDSAANPGKITIAGNIGATTYLTAMLLNKVGGAFNIVNHGGSSERITALLGGHVDVIQNPLVNIKSYIENGEVRVLANQADPRPPLAQEYPTLKESGYDVVFQYRYYFLFPKGTPRAIVDKMADAVEKVVTTNPEYAEDIKKTLVQSPFFARGEQAQKLMDAQEATVNSVNLK
jgi:tripartite-type tricarboxylate transporter receptor subunit TctC